MRGSWVDTERASVAEVADGGRHVLGVEGAGDAERDQPGLGRRVVGEAPASCSRVPAATIWPGPLSLAAVRPCLLEGGEHLVAVAAEDGGHAGRR